MRPTCHLALTALSISLDHAIVAVFSVADSHGQRPWALVSSTKVQVSYHGVNAHAAGAPWEGVNGTNHPILALSLPVALHSEPVVGCVFRSAGRGSAGVLQHLDDAAADEAHLARASHNHGHPRHPPTPRPTTP